MFIKSMNFDGHFCLCVADANLRLSTILLKYPLPSHLIEVTPFVILECDHCSYIQLVFLRVDLSPEVIVLKDTWSAIVERSLKISRASLLPDSDEEIKSLKHLFELETKRKEKHGHALS